MIMKRKGAILLIIIISLIISLFLIRAISKKEIDDVSPKIPCSEEYLKKSDILWIIPKFQGEPISKDKEWCDYILNLNKTLGLHGVFHEFEEFNSNRNSSYLEEGIYIFEKCLKFKPEIFKPPQLKISDENKKLIKNNNLKLKGRFNQIIHKVYHCDDSQARFPNWFIDIF